MLMTFVLRMKLMTKKYCGGNVGNSGKKMCIVKDCVMQRHAIQKSMWNEIDSYVQLQSGEYIFMTVIQNETLVWVHSCIAFERLEHQWQVFKTQCHPKGDLFELFNGIQGNHITKDNISFALAKITKEVALEDGYMLLCRRSPVENKDDKRFCGDWGWIVFCQRKFF